MLPRILPFALYMAFIAVEPALQWLGTWFPTLQSWTALAPLWLYPVKTAVVLSALLVFWSQYTELKEKMFASIGQVLLALGVGVVVYLAWVRMDWSWAMQGASTGYNPFEADAGAGGVLAGIRIFGAALVVPVMEELFWRSFLIRWLVATPFTSARLGAFTPFSFLATVVLFGLEHNLWLAGMMAGICYNALLYQSRNLWSCILAHAVTNLLLGIHVLLTNEWQWW